MLIASEEQRESRPPTHHLAVSIAESGWAFLRGSTNDRRISNVNTRKDDGNMKLIMRLERWSVSRRGRRFPARFSRCSGSARHSRARAFDCHTQQQLFAFKQKVNFARGCVTRHNNKSYVWEKSLCIYFSPRIAHLRKMSEEFQLSHFGGSDIEERLFFSFSLLSQKFYF